MQLSAPLRILCRLTSGKCHRTALGGALGAGAAADAREDRDRVLEFIHGPLAENPHRVGRPLLEPLAPQYWARRGEHRVLYLIEDEQVTITSITRRRLPPAMKAAIP